MHPVVTKRGETEDGRTSVRMPSVPTRPNSLSRDPVAAHLAAVEVVAAEAEVEDSGAVVDVVTGLPVEPRQRSSLEIVGTAVNQVTRVPTAPS